MNVSPDPPHAFTASLLTEVTMKSYYILSAIGKDRPGIVADVSEVIYECGGNIEDSNMGLLRTHFALLILFSAEKEEVDQKLSPG